MTITDCRSAVLGIDPGLDGGVATLILNDNGEIDKIFVQPMPTKAGAKKGREVDGKALAYIVDEAPYENDASIKLAGIEIVHAMKGQGVTSCFTFGKGFGRVLGVLEALDIPICEVQPQRWKKSILDGLGHEKSDAIRYCTNRWPTVSFLKPVKVGKPKTVHDGMADAACLAEYARRQLLGLAPVQNYLSIQETPPDKTRSRRKIVAGIPISKPENVAVVGRLEQLLDNWYLSYNVSDGRINKLKLDADTEAEAVVESSRFLQVPEHQIKVCKFTE